MAAKPGFGSTTLAYLLCVQQGHLEQVFGKKCGDCQKSRVHFKPCGIMIKIQNLIAGGKFKLLQCLRSQFTVLNQQTSQMERVRYAGRFYFLVISLVRSLR